MRKSRFTTEQIIGFLKQVEAGMAIERWPGSSSRASGRSRDASGGGSVPLWYVPSFLPICTVGDLRPYLDVEAGGATTINGSDL
ncbi:hypothetical protein [Marilutibacter maris]|uniref:hypothetical protein n=1 Tax=Marilutibacter maris TaxID=1605891 RepID=UPI0011AE764B|nr:hypothetical protein [Lysobacter maris]